MLYHTMLQGNANHNVSLRTKRIVENAAVSLKRWQLTKDRGLKDLRCLPNLTLLLDDGSYPINPALVERCVARAVTKVPSLAMAAQRNDLLRLLLPGSENRA